MPRRYPRLQAKDKHGNIVGIPLSIAPRLLPNEEFVSLPQEKVNAIAEANERIRSQEAATSLSPKPSSQPTPDNKSAYKEDDEVSLHENVGSSITGTVTPERSSASSSQDPVRNVATVKPKRGKKRVRRLWTEEEDKIVLCAVSQNETGASLIGRLPNRSRSAVLKRFYILREKWKNDRRRVHDGRLNSASEMDTPEKVGESSDLGAGEEVGDGSEEEKDDDGLIEVESDKDVEDDEDANVEDGNVGNGAMSLDEYESYDENADSEADEDFDEDSGAEKLASDVEDGYRPDEEMDEIAPLE